jgi:hypothetical protein
MRIAAQSYANKPPAWQGKVLRANASCISVFVGDAGASQQRSTAERVNEI